MIERIRLLMWQSIFDLAEPISFVNFLATFKVVSDISKILQEEKICLIQPYVRNPEALILNAWKNQEMRDARLTKYYYIRTGKLGTTILGICNDRRSLEVAEHYEAFFTSCENVGI